VFTFPFIVCEKKEGGGRRIALPCILTEFVGPAAIGEGAATSRSRKIVMRGRKDEKFYELP